MAKRKSGGVNKSAAIRGVYEQNPNLSVKEVISTLASRGLEVKDSLVYFIKARLKQRKRKEIRKSMTAAGVPNAVDLILNVRKLAVEAGGMKKLKQLVDALSE